MAALQACDASHYPDPHYTALRQRLADFHGVDSSRIVLAASASEFISRITAWVARQGAPTLVCRPMPTATIRRQRENAIWR
jgi:histidinol-phosphate aminotransferase